MLVVTVVTDSHFLGFPIGKPTGRSPCQLSLLALLARYGGRRFMTFQGATGAAPARARRRCSPLRAASSALA
jgi:hypothetical protein